MDWLCGPAVLARTGLSVPEHQARTVGSYLDLSALAPDLPWRPVLQGWTLADYHRCADLYEAAGVDLAALPVVGLGSIAGRQHQGAVAVVCESLAQRGLALHGFGMKVQGLRLAAHALASADSLSWSYDARRDGHHRRDRGLPLSRYGCTHGRDGNGGCGNCPTYALAWREQLMGGLEWSQLSLDLGHSTA